MQTVDACASRLGNFHTRHSSSSKQKLGESKQESKRERKIESFLRGLKFSKGREERSKKEQKEGQGPSENRHGLVKLMNEKFK